MIPVVALAGCHSNERDSNIVLVFAAASLTDALSEIADDFTRQTDIDIQCNFAATSTLAQQINHGATPDLFIAANEDWMRQVQDNNLVAETTPLIANRLVIVVHANAPQQPERLEELLSDHYKKIAFGDPDSVPAGIYARRALKKSGIWEQIRVKAVYGVHVRQALAMMENEVTDAAMVYDTDARVSELVRVAYKIGRELTGTISYPVAIMKTAENSENAKRFYDFLNSERAQQIFREHGFIELDAGNQSMDSQ